MPDIFDKVNLDVFDKIGYDIFEKLDLPIEDKVIFSDQMSQFFRRSLKDEMGKMPIGKIVGRIIAREMERQERSNGLVKDLIRRKIEESSKDLKKEVDQTKTEIKRDEEKFMDLVRKKHDEIKNQILSQDNYVFGGFNPENAGDVTFNGVITHEKASKYPVRTVTDSSVTIDDSYQTILCDCTSNTITINLPVASGNAGLYYIVKKIDSSANAVTIDGNGSETIDGSTTAVINIQYTSLQIKCDGSNWHIL